MARFLAIVSDEPLPLEIRNLGLRLRPSAGHNRQNASVASVADCRRRRGCRQSHPAWRLVERRKAGHLDAELRRLHCRCTQRLATHDVPLLLGRLTIHLSPPKRRPTNVYRSASVATPGSATLETQFGADLVGDRRRGRVIVGTAGRVRAPRERAAASRSRAFDRRGGDARWGAAAIMPRDVDETPTRERASPIWRLGPPPRRRSRPR